MQTMPAARPSRPSTKLTALMVMTTSATVSSVPCHWVSATVPTPGIGQPQDRQTLHDHHARGDHLAAELDQGVDLELVVQHADQPDQGRRRRAGRAVRWSCSKTLVQVRQMVGDQQSRAQSEEHRDAAEPRCRLAVHVTGTDLRHGSGHDRELPHRPGQQIGHRGRDAERQQVFTHGLPHRSRWPSQPHTLAMSRIRLRTSGSDDGCTCGCAPLVTVPRQPGYGGNLRRQLRDFRTRVRARDPPRAARPRAARRSAPSPASPMPWVVTRGRAEPQPAGVRRTGSAQVSSTMPGGGEPAARGAAVDAERGRIGGDQVGVGAAGGDAKPLGGQRGGQHPGVGDDLVGVRA